MTRKAVLMALLALPCALVAAGVPFRLPLGAEITETSVKGGWSTTGTIDVTFVQAKTRFLVALTSSGWQLRHSVPLGTQEDRILLTFRRASQELTLMLWRMDVAKSGFSCGLSGVNEETRKK